MFAVRFVTKSVHFMNVIVLHKQQGDNAEKLARQNQAQKSMNACKTRLEKEKKQHENMRRSVCYFMLTSQQ